MSDHRQPANHHRTRSEIARRWFFQQCGLGLAPLAATTLLQETAVSASMARKSDESLLGPLPGQPDVRQSHFPGKAKRVIYLFQAGAPSHLELFDPKPELQRLNGSLPPAELLEGYRAAFIKPNSALLGGKFSFAKHGQSGIELSEVLPHTAKIVDDLCLIRSVQTNAVNHAPAQIMMNTGSEQFGRPSFGAWTVYGLGSEAADFPGFVVLTSAKGTSGGASNYGSGFLPTPYGGVPFRSGGDPVLYLSNPPGIDQQAQRDSITALNRLNRLAADAYGDPQIEARIQSYEMAYRLQMSAPQLMDLADESAETLAGYGVKDAKESSFAKNCLLARRMIERGVRFVQLFHEAWDQHGDLTNGVRTNAKDTDQASAALVTDLKQRGLLEDTLVIWGGEFGRTPMAQGGTDGRDHHNRCFSLWLAGGGIKPGHVHGQTDELGFNVVSSPVHVHDLNATLLHLLGFDHTRLTFRFQGRDYRLTDVHGEVVREILA
ncbi:MAG: DUF1501 domain-containing protein [Pirellulaceae bacterium]|nr:DUF1501 domain-containing protein [Pirellulaceae bacterium]